MKTLILLGTSRKNNSSAQVFDALTKELAKHSEVTAVRPEDVLTAPATERVKDVTAESSPLHAWQSQVLEVDKIVMVIPEYNHSFPGEWKMMVDALAPADCAGKPVYLATVSAGSFAGVRVYEHAQPVLHTLGFALQKNALHVANVGDVYHEGEATAGEVQERLQSFVSAVIA